MDFEQLLANLLPLVGEHVDAEVWHCAEGEQMPVAMVSGALRGALPVAAEAQAEPEELIHLAISDREGEAGAAILLDRRLYSGGEVDDDGISMLLGELEVHLRPTLP